MSQEDLNLGGRSVFRREVDGLDTWVSVESISMSAVNASMTDRCEVCLAEVGEKWWLIVIENILELGGGL